MSEQTTGFDQEQYEMGWNDLHGNAYMRPPGDRIAFLSRMAEAAQNDQQTSPSFRKGVLEAANHLLAGGKPSYTGPDWVVESLLERVPLE